MVLSDIVSKILYLPLNQSENVYLVGETLIHEEFSSEKNSGIQLFA